MTDNTTPSVFSINFLKEWLPYAGSALGILLGWLVILGWFFSDGYAYGLGINTYSVNFLSNDNNRAAVYGFIIATLPLLIFLFIGLSVFFALIGAFNSAQQNKFGVFETLVGLTICIVMGLAIDVQVNNDWINNGWWPLPLTVSVVFLIMTTLPWEAIIIKTVEIFWVKKDQDFKNSARKRIASIVGFFKYPLTLGVLGTSVITILLYVYPGWIIGLRQTLCDFNGGGCVIYIQGLVGWYFFGFIGSLIFFRNSRIGLMYWSLVGFQIALFISKYSNNSFWIAPLWIVFTLSFIWALWLWLKPITTINQSERVGFFIGSGLIVSLGLIFAFIASIGYATEYGKKQGCAFVAKEAPIAIMIGTTPYLLVGKPPTMLGVDAYEYSSLYLVYQNDERYFLATALPNCTNDSQPSILVVPANQVISLHMEQRPPP